MAPDEARPQSNEREPVKTAQGLDSASSSPKPAEPPAEQSAAPARPPTGEVSPDAAAESKPAPTEATPAAPAPVPRESVPDEPAPVATASGPTEPEEARGVATTEDTSSQQAPAAVAESKPAETASSEAAPADAAKPADSSTATEPDAHAGESPSAPTDVSTTDPYHSEYHQHDEYHDHYHEQHPEEHYDYHGSHTEATGGIPPPEEPVDPLFAGEEGGGPVKSFLEHLEDFRWIIIKCATAIMIAMVVCLLGANYVIAILKWPLERATHLYTDKRQHVSVMMGPKELFNFKLATNNLPAWPIATNKFIELELVPMDIGTNRILTLGVRSVGDTVPPEKAKPIIYKSPAEPFVNSLHIAFFGGLLFAAPFVIFFLADFILPALKPKEKKYFLKAMAPAAFLFLMGVCLCYFLILPLALRAAEQYSLWMGVEMPFWQAAEYFGFCIKFMLGMGLGFEMPVVLLALVKIGLLDYQKLAAWRRYMILINLVLGALLTTPEVLTQVAMFFPLQTLYELTIWIAWYWEQEDRALARRRLAMVIGGIVVAGELVWLAVQFGWPWLRQFLH